MRKLTTDNLQRTTDKGFTLIEILVVIGIIAILAAIVLIAINPAKQFRDANDTQRSANVNAIINAIGQHVVDHNGNPPTGVSTTTMAATDISSGGIGSDFCTDLVPTYIPALPIDPSLEGDGQVAVGECGSYDTGYELEVDASGRVTVSAPLTQGSTTTISVTR